MRIEGFPPRPCPPAEFAMDQMTPIFHRLPPSGAEGAAVPSSSCCGQMNPGCPPSEWLLCLRSDYVSGAMKAVLFLRLHHRHPAIVAFSPSIPASITAPHIPGVGQPPQLWASLCRRKHFFKIFFSTKNTPLRSWMHKPLVCKPPSPPRPPHVHLLTRSGRLLLLAGL